VKLDELKKSKLYSEELGIDLAKGGREIFKWFIASFLFGKRISEKLAKRTYKTFEKYNLLDPKKMLDAGWDELVSVLDEGGYVRYDFSTATRLLEICEKLLKEYGSLENLHERAKDERDLERRLLEFKGIGPVTVNIFLRELRPFWKKANPDVLPKVKEYAKELGIDLDKFNRKEMEFVRLEAGLIRLRKTRDKKNLA